MSEYRRIENITGWVHVHGDELGPGPIIGGSLVDTPMPGVEFYVANPLARSLGVRFIDVNLSFCLQNPDAYPDTYEALLVPKILEISESSDLVLDFHGRHAEGDVAYVGPRVYPHVLGFVALAGIETIIVAQGGLHGRLPNTVLLDTSEQSELRNVFKNSNYWRELFATALHDGVPLPSLEKFRIFAHANIPLEERLKDSVLEREVWQPFSLPKSGLDRPLYPVHRFTAAYPWVEAVSPIDQDEIVAEPDMITFPTLRTDQFADTNFQQRKPRRKYIQERIESSPPLPDTVHHYASTLLSPGMEAGWLYSLLCQDKGEDAQQRLYEMVMTM